MSLGYCPTCRVLTTGSVCIRCNGRTARIKGIVIEEARLSESDVVKELFRTPVNNKNAEKQEG